MNEGGSGARGWLRLRLAGGIVMRIIKVTTLMAVALVAAATAQPASALCSGARLISGCAGTCKYIYIGAQGQSHGPSPALRGNFWGLGGGNPAPGLGDDNGLDEAQGNADPNIDWVKSYVDSGSVWHYLGGAWSNALVDGCVDDATTPSPKRTVVALYDQAPSLRPSSSQLAGYFAVLCNRANIYSNYDYDGTPGDHILAPIPYPSVHASGQGSVIVYPPAPSLLAPGIYALDPSCTNLVRGYKICSQVAGGYPSDLNRLTGGWTCGSEMTTEWTTVPVPPCGTSQLMFLATSLVFDGGFETLFVSEPTSVSCGLTADRPGAFKLIKKPGEVPRNRQ